MSVNALPIRGDHMRALAAIGHDKFLAVARAASRRNVGVTYARFWIGRRQQVVRAAVTIHAGGGVAVSAGHGFGVVAAVVGGLLVSVAAGTADFLWRGFVCRALHICMAVHTGEHAAVNGIFEGFRIDVQAYLFAVDLMCEAGITMAGEALLDGRLGRIFFAGCGKGRGG